MARRIRPVGHEDRLSLVDHLDELRTRIILSLVAFGVALALCFWQNHLILRIVNDPLNGRKPITLGVAEPFTTTFTLSAYAAILIALPVVLYQLYAFILPAFTPGERRVAMPLLLMVPFLFIGGVVFGYYVVLPAALKFLLHFNTDQFRVEIRARDYYSFVSMTLVACGLLFQIPVGILGLNRMGIVTPRQLRKNRRDAFKGGGGSSSAEKTIQKQIDNAQKQLAANPHNQAALQQLIRDNYQLASLSADQTTGTFSADGKKNLQQASIAWQRYLATNPA